MWLGLGIRITNWWRTLAANGPFNNHATLTDGLVSYWKLDEQSGVRYDSITDSANDLTDNNTVTYVNAGPDEVVASFVDGASESLSKTVALDLSAGFTVAAWVALDRIGAGDNFSPFNVTNRAIELQTASNTVRILIHTGSGYFTELLTVGFDTGYHLWSAKFTGTELYVGFDGVWQSGPTAVTGTLDTTDVIKLGYSAPAGADGTATEGRVGLWSTALGDDELLSVYNTGAGKLYSDLTDAEKVGLVSYWNLDEESGVRYDSHGSNDLTDNNTVLSATNAVPPPKNIAAYFTYTNSERLSRTNTNFGFGSGDFTLAGWLNSTGISGTYQVVWQKNGANDFQLDLNGTGMTVRWLVYNGAGFYQADASNVSINTWHQFICWYTASDKTAHLVIDNGTATTGTGGGSYTESTATFTIGAQNAAFPYNGSIDEVGAWNRALTVDEREALWNEGRGLYYGDTGLDTDTYYLLQEDGSSHFLLEDGTSVLLKN